MAFKIIHVVILASVKYFMTFPYALIIGLDYNLAMLIVIAGGVGGFLFFYYISRYINFGLNRSKPFFCRFIPRVVKARYQSYCERRKAKITKKFSRKSRFIVKIRRSYGMWGIVITTPVLLTIPLGAFLANKYYSRRKNVVLYMVLSIVMWGAALSAFLQIFPAAVK